MRFARTLTITTLAVALAAAGCGQTNDTLETADDTPTTTTATLSTTMSTAGVQVDTDPTITTPISADLAGKLADAKLRGKVKAEIAKWVDKYDYIVAAFSTTGTDVTDANVDEAITGACTGVDPVADIGGLAFYAGESMKAHGHDMLEVMADTKALNAKVADLADC